MRVEIPHTIRRANGSVAAGATAYVYSRGTTTPVTVYLNQTGGTTVAQPLTADGNGKIVGWIESDEVDIVATVDGVVQSAQQWAARISEVPSCRAYATAAQSIPTGAWTPLNLAGETWDTNGMHDTVTNNNRIVLNKAGIYLIEGGISFASQTTNERGAAIRLNGGAHIEMVLRKSVQSAQNDSISISGVWRVTSETDWIELAGFQNSGGALNTVVTGTNIPYLAATWVAPA